MKINLVTRTGHVALEVDGHKDFDQEPIEAPQDHEAFLQAASRRLARFAHYLATVREG